MNTSGNVFALIDCNSFYCNCERICRPALKRRPVAVLSNNDGRVIAHIDRINLKEGRGAIRIGRVP